MAVASNDGISKFPKEYLENGIERLEDEDTENPTTETESATGVVPEALENLEVE